MAQISLNNGTTHTDVADLSDAQVADALDQIGNDCRGCDAPDDDHSAPQTVVDSASGDTDREWLTSFCGLWADEYGSAYVIG
jgi:hypothetical protein